jgi:hypothetical protein
VQLAARQPAHIRGRFDGIEQLVCHRQLSRSTTLSARRPSHTVSARPDCTSAA